jgi:hypothetical protein
VRVMLARSKPEGLAQAANHRVVRVSALQQECW